MDKTNAPFAKSTEEMENIKGVSGIGVHFVVEKTKKQIDNIYSKFEQMDLKFKTNKMSLPEMTQEHLKKEMELHQLLAGREREFKAKLAQEVVKTKLELHEYFRDQLDVFKTRLAKVNEMEEEREKKKKKEGETGVAPGFTSVILRPPKSSQGDEKPAELESITEEEEEEGFRV